MTSKDIRTYFSESSHCLCITLAAHDNNQILVLRLVRKIYKLGTMDKNDSFTQSELFVLSKFGLHYFTHGKKAPPKKTNPFVIADFIFWYICTKILQALEDLMNVEHGHYLNEVPGLSTSIFYVF